MASISNFLFSLPTSLFPQQSQNSEETVNTDENTDNSIEASMDESNLPITGICLVTKPGNVPTGYQCIRKGKQLGCTLPSERQDTECYHRLVCLLAYDDRNKDADLMPDSFLERKDRFVCITHVYPLAGDRAFVLEDIKLINERDNPPPSYIPLIQTVDTAEKATAKRTICVKLVDRQAGMKCICDIIFLYRAKRPPQSYTIIGEINALQICVKEGTVPPLRPAPPVPSYSKPPSNLYPNPHNDQPYYGSQQSYGGSDHANANTLAKKSDEKEMLEGIPFQINPKYLNTNQRNGGNLGDVNSCRILSSYEIEQMFHYDFNLERSSL